MGKSERLLSCDMTVRSSGIQRSNEKALQSPVNLLQTKRAFPHSAPKCQFPYGRRGHSRRTLSQRKGRRRETDSSHTPLQWSASLRRRRPGLMSWRLQLRQPSQMANASTPAQNRGRFVPFREFPSLKEGTTTAASRCGLTHHMAATIPSSLENKYSGNT